MLTLTRFTILQSLTVHDTAGGSTHPLLPPILDPSRCLQDPLPRTGKAVTGLVHGRSIDSSTTDCRLCNYPMGLVLDPQPCLDIPFKCHRWSYSLQDTGRGSLLFHRSDIQHLLALPNPQQTYISPSIPPDGAVERRLDIFAALEMAWSSTSTGGDRWRRKIGP